MLGRLGYKNEVYIYEGIKLAESIGLADKFRFEVRGVHFFGLLCVAAPGVIIIASVEGNAGDDDNRVN